LPDKALDTARGLLDDAVSPVLAARLEDETGLDRYTLARSFRDRFGTSPHRYLVGRRLERVRAEIAHGASLADAAMQSRLSARVQFPSFCPELLMSSR
jgi:AraC-like DNA-binding protein